MQACIFSSPGIEGSKRDEARVEGPGEERRRLPVAAAEHLGDARGHEARHEAEQHEGHDLGAVKFKSGARPFAFSRHFLFSPYRPFSGHFPF